MSLRLEKLDVRKMKENRKVVYNAMIEMEIMRIEGLLCHKHSYFVPSNFVHELHFHFDVDTCHESI